MSEQSPATSPLDQLRSGLDNAVLAITGGERPNSRPSLERPKQAAHGDFATNAAMLLPKLMGAAPPMIAERLLVALDEEFSGAFEGTEVAGPGFINIKLAPSWLDGALDQVLASGASYGSGGAKRKDDGEAESVHLEFVSNNPTGPVHIGGARGAALGSALARLLEFYGFSVHREYYVNDFGNQVDLFGQSLKARANGEEPPEDGYQGDYITEVASRIPDAATLPADEVARAGIDLMVATQAASLERFRTTFDLWFRESNLHQVRDSGESEVEEAFEVLAKQGRTYEQDGALFLRTTEFGDDKDRVLRRSDGRTTYFASDVAYHHDKRIRGFDHVLNVLGADHHGYIARVTAAFVALGGDADQIELMITQQVNLWKDGERVKMSKRAGEFVTLDDLNDDIGVDAARWYLLSRSHDTTIDLDLDQARSESSENPVYYVQYAHARISSILQRAAEEGVLSRDASVRELAQSDSYGASERELLLALLAWPDEVREAADRRAPHRLTTYALSLSRQFSAFYRDCRVFDTDEVKVTRAQQVRRLALCEATKSVIASALGILEVDAPERMSSSELEDAEPQAS